MDISTIKDMNVIGGDKTNPGTLGETDYAYQANAPLYASDLNYFAAETTNITHPFANIIYDINAKNTLSTDDGIYGEIVSAFQTATSLTNFSISISSSGYLSYDIMLDVFGKDYEFSASSIAIKAYSATRLATARTITLSNDAGGSVSFNGTANVTLAASVNRSDYAETAAQLVGQDKAAVNEGSDSAPVYIKEGVPVACTSAAVHSAEILTGGSTAYSVGSSSNPVYFADGVPVACGSVAAYSANKLATARTISLSGDTTGSASFNGTANVTIDTTTSHATTADSAETAESATTADSAATADALSVGTIGSTSKPVYFSNGLPTVATAVPRLYLHKTSLGAYAVSSYPQYYFYWLSTESSAVSSFSDINLDAIIGGEYMASASIIYYGCIVGCLMSSGDSYTFRWLRWDSSTGAMISQYNTTINPYSGMVLAVSDTVINL